MLLLLQSVHRGALKTKGWQPRRIRNETGIRKKKKKQKKNRRTEEEEEEEEKIKRKEDMHPFLPTLVKGLERAREGPSRVQGAGESSTEWVEGKGEQSG